MKIGLQKNKVTGFTLIELLATLLIMALIAALLFPYIVRYVQKAEHAIAVRSLRLLQDAMDRYRVAKYNFDDWQIGSINHGSVLTNYQQLSMNDVDTILKSVSDASSSDRTIRLPIGDLMRENVVIISTDVERDKASWEVMRYRRTTNIMGVDRKGEDVTNMDLLFIAPSPDEIDAAFR